jgi:ribulose-5-phosphate 4-epimerase/fuculose-1-phosphate aldolase
MYVGSDRQDMLVNTVRLGASLAEAFGEPSTSGPPERNVVLMKHHGYTTHGKDIATACYRTIYTLINAGIQTNATLLQAAAKAGGSVESATVHGLSERHARDCQIMAETTQDKAWRLWSREVGASPLYSDRV